MELVQTEAELDSGQRDPVGGPRDWAIPGLLVVSAFGFRVMLGYLFTYYGGDAPGYTIVGRNLRAGHGYKRRDPCSLFGNRHPVTGLPSFVGCRVLCQYLALGCHPSQCATWSHQYVVGLVHRPWAASDAACGAVVHGDRRLLHCGCVVRGNCGIREPVRSRCVGLRLRRVGQASAKPPLTLRSRQRLGLDRGLDTRRTRAVCGFGGCRGGPSSQAQGGRHRAAGGVFPPRTRSLGHPQPRPNPSDRVGGLVDVGFRRGSDAQRTELLGPVVCQITEHGVRSAHDAGAARPNSISRSTPTQST